MQARSRLRRSVIFGVAAAGLGGILWAAMAFGAGEKEALKAVAVAAAFRGVAGLIIGAFGPQPMQTTSSGEELPRANRTLTVFKTLGGFIYRVLVGFLVYMIGSSVLLLVILTVGVAFYGSLDELLKRAHWDSLTCAVECGIFGTCGGGSLGALLGAILGPLGFHGRREGRTSSTAITGWALGTAIGFAFGLICSILSTNRLSAMEHALVGGVGAGFSGALLGWLLDEWRRPKSTTTP